MTISISSNSVVVLTIFICILLFAIILLILALYCFIKTLYTREYKMVEIDDLIVENNNKADEDKVAFFMTNHYHKILDYNINVNNGKVSNCTKGIVTTVV